MTPIGGDPSPASTVLVIRDGPAAVEVYMQRRPTSMPFAAEQWVFPGGRIDPADLDPAIDVHWSGPPPSTWARRLDVDDALAVSYPLLIMWPPSIALLWVTVLLVGIAGVEQRSFDRPPRVSLST